MASQQHGVPGEHFRDAAFLHFRRPHQHHLPQLRRAPGAGEPAQPVHPVSGEGQHGKGEFSLWTLPAPIAASGQDSLRTYYHFPSTVSNDPERNVIAMLDSSTYQRTYLVNTVPGRDTLQVRADFTLRRYDGFAAAPVSTSHPAAVHGHAD
jgi:hypothetical protein